MNTSYPKIFLRLVIMFFLPAAFTGCCLIPENHPETTGQAVVKTPKNFHRVSDSIFRSGQPDDGEFTFLYTAYGIRSILNLREYHSDQDAVSAVNEKHPGAIQLYEIPLNTAKISANDLIRILTVIKNAPKPLLIHCWHGSDRTGCAVAAYRIVFENWTPQAAVDELMTPEYGHHRNIYPNIPELLTHADWNAIKSALDIQ